MSLPGSAEDFLERGFSRRQLGRIATLLTAGASLPFYNEFAMAQQAERRMRSIDPDAVRINQNENPMGPCKEGLEALTRVAPHGWRYSPANEQGELVRAISETEGVPPDHVAVYAGSSDPLLRAMCAFTSPTASWCMADPGYGGGAPAFIGSKLVRVPLRADYSHNVEAMIQAAPDAGAYYVVNPNNPTGTATPLKDIEYLLAHKQKNAVVIVDEAYIHFADAPQPATYMAIQGKDVLVMRTFSKIYGMAGLRAGFVMGRPDLLAKLRPYGVGFLPVTALACAAASLRVKDLVSERRALNKRRREDVFAFLEKKRVKYIPSQTNFFMMEVGRPGQEFADAMAREKVIVGRIWQTWPTKVRVSIGNDEEMGKFRAAFDRVWG